MARLKVVTIGAGQHPSEVVVAVTTADGTKEELIVDKRSLSGESPRESLRIGYPIGSRNNDLLVELPRETLRGAWRVWVNRREVEEAPA